MVNRSPPAGTAGHSVSALPTSAMLPTTRWRGLAGGHSRRSGATSCRWALSTAKGSVQHVAAASRAPSFWAYQASPTSVVPRPWPEALRPRAGRATPRHPHHPHCTPATDAHPACALLHPDPRTAPVLCAPWPRATDVGGDAWAGRARPGGWRWSAPHTAAHMHPGPYSRQPPSTGSLVRHPHQARCRPCVSAQVLLTTRRGEWAGGGLGRTW